MARKGRKTEGRLSERKEMTEKGLWPKGIEKKKKQRKGHGCKRKQRKKVSAK